MPHNLVKNSQKEWECKVCKWTWQSKPNSICPGVQRYSWGCQPAHLMDEIALHKRNLKPKKGAKPSGVVYWMRKSYYIEYYDEKDCEINNPKLPPIYQWDNLGEFKTIGQLSKLNLSPVDESLPRGVANVWDYENKTGVWVNLYHQDDCKSKQEVWITKTQLKQKYFLSEGWIKRLGQPDKLVDHPKYYNAVIKLYKVERVETFLAENAEDYANWLERRKRHLAIFEANRDKIFARREALKQQTQQCLKCASGCTLPNGFFCAVHPLGLEKIPCYDFQERGLHRQ